MKAKNSHFVRNEVLLEPTGTKPTGKLRRCITRALLGLLLLLALMPVLYYAAHHAMLAKVRHDIRGEFSRDYAILKLHVDGENTMNPSLWRMLEQAWEYRFSGNYGPQGSAGLTGKKHYLTMLITDNERIGTCHWSFRKLGIEFQLDESPWCRIGIFPRDALPRYRYNPEKRIRKHGLWFAPKAMRDPDVRFYSYGVSWGPVGTGAMAPDDWPQQKKIDFYIDNLRYPRKPASEPGGRDWYAAFWQLGEIGGPAIPHLFELLETLDDPHDRMLVLYTIPSAASASSDLYPTTGREIIEYHNSPWEIDHIEENTRRARDWYEKWQSAEQGQDLPKEEL